MNTYTATAHNGPWSSLKIYEGQAKTAKAAAKDAFKFFQSHKMKCERLKVLEWNADQTQPPAYHEFTVDEKGKVTCVP